jgi:outer membrane protein, heavy metal efflux system
MTSQSKWLAYCVILCSACRLCPAEDAAAVWSETQLIERFLAQSPQARELRSRVALVEAEGRTRTAYANPSVSFSWEGAGYSAYYVEGSQTLPVSGRLGYLRQAVGASAAAADLSREGQLWSLRSDLRIAFFRMVAAQERVNVLSNRIGEVEGLVRILRRREEEGEGSRYDRLRAERELVELRTDAIMARSLIAAAGAQLAAFLPEGARVERVRGDLRIVSEVPNLENLVRRALLVRADYQAEQKDRGRYLIEEQAARRLRIPEPVVSAGVERAEVTAGTGANPFSNVTRNGLAFSVSVPLPILNSGRYEVARYQAEQEQADARIAVLSRQIRTEVEGALTALDVRREAQTAFEREMESSGPELVRIAQTAYQEGEIGILELLDAYRVNGAANLRRLDLKAGVKEAFIELERAVGEELTAQEVQR